MDYSLTRYISLALLLILNFFEYLKGVYRVQTKSFRVKRHILTVISLLSALEILLTFLQDGYRYCWFTALTRILILILLVRQIRNTWVRFMFVIYDSKQMILFIAFYVVFFAFLG